MGYCAERRESFLLGRVLLRQLLERSDGKATRVCPVGSTFYSSYFKKKNKKTSRVLKEIKSVTKNQKILITHTHTMKIREE